MGVWGLILGLAAGATLAFTMATNRPYSRHLDALILAWLMAGSWFFCAMADTFLSPPHSKALNGPMDAGLGAIVLALMLTRRDWWKVPLLGLLLVQGFLDFTYQANAEQPGVFDWYALWLQVTFAGILLCINVPGGGYVIASLRDFRRRARPLRPHTTLRMGH